MSQQIPVEQDQNLPLGGDELPTYDDLAAQSGPNSRFGRWKGWIEKRAAERYMDISPQERYRRRERGWGNDDQDLTGLEPDPYESSSVPMIVNEPPTPTPMNLHIQTNNLSLNAVHVPAVVPPSPPLPPLPFVSQKLPPTHLKLNQFGSRFLPHTTSPIRCLLPLMYDRLLLIGHDEGLSVLDMFPQEWTESGLSFKGPDEAQARLIWQGESVYQMSILEVEDTGEGTPQGVVLALVGPEPDTPSSKEGDSPRTLRMYNLGSLTSLAKWAVAQKGARPLDLHRPPNWHVQQTPTKKHRPQSSITRSLKSLIDTSTESATSSYNNLLSPSASMSTSGQFRSSSSSGSGTPNRKISIDSTSSWDVVDDLPLRWATDFVPLASAGSRLLNASILSYALWRDDNRTGKGGQLLAVATKSNILLYETPRGERAFRFVKEYYTPLQPRSLTFFHQSGHEVARSASDVGMTPSRYGPHSRSDSTSTVRNPPTHSSVPSNMVTYGPQLSLYVVFDKKAGWIRLADSAVGEVELYDDKSTHHHHNRDSLAPSSNMAPMRKNRISMDLSTHSAKWLPLVRCDLPVHPSHQHRSSTQTIHILTKGKYSHILPAPLPVNIAGRLPLRVVLWETAPTHVTPRVFHGSDIDDAEPYIQLVAFGEQGVEVQELSLSFLSSKGKGKARMEDLVCANEDIGGDTGFLCVGGHWDHPHYPYDQHPLSRSYSMSSDMSGASFESMESEEIKLKLKKAEGIYGWCRKGVSDWRVFWVGGSFTGSPGGQDDDEFS